MEKYKSVSAVKKEESEYTLSKETRQRGQGTKFVGIKGKRHKLWWFRNSNAIGDVAILVKEELSEKIVEIKRKISRVIAWTLVFEEEVIKSHMQYSPQMRRSV